MPAPYRDLAGLIEDAEAQHVPPLEYALDVAAGHDWTPGHTLDVLDAIRRETRKPRPRSEFQRLAATVDEFRRDLDDADDDPADDLEHATANYLSAEWALAQGAGTADDLDALHYWAERIAQRIGRE